MNATESITRVTSGRGGHRGDRARLAASAPPEELGTFWRQRQAALEPRFERGRAGVIDA
jgi:hypothetical protein